MLNIIHGSILVQHERQSVADQIALRLLTKTYDELAQLEGERNADAFLTQQGVDIYGNPHVSLMISRGGRIRKRMCVEITVTGVPFNAKEQPGCVYFEKYSSGKLVAYGLIAGKE